MLFLTGSTGFIGQHLVGRLMRDRPCGIRCLIRAGHGPRMLSEVAEVVQGDLREPATYIEALRGCQLIVHLAAVTGRAHATDYFGVNETGTRKLLDASREAGVRRVIFVSSIATTYRNTAAYPYAQSKQRAEELVRASGLNFLIVRPTLVLGPGSPIWKKLRALAALPVMPIIGDGSVRVQPIDVDDVSNFLMAAIDEAVLPDTTVGLGGPDVVTLEDLLRRTRRATGKGDSFVVHVPGIGTISLLNWLERWLPIRLPVTAGQLSVFVNDGLASQDWLTTERVPPRKTIDDMLEYLICHG